MSQTAPHFYPVDPPPGLEPPEPVHGVALRCACRSLDGMLKEAVVSSSATGRAWRLLSDEGPYLNGGDLAPCPLAFMTTGMVAGFLHSLRILAAAQRLAFAEPRLVQENYYGMEGSALRGTMTGSAFPVRLSVTGLGSGDRQVMPAAVQQAIAATPVAGLVHDTLVSEFSLSLNGESLAPGRVRATRLQVPDIGYGLLDALGPPTDADPGLVRRLEAVETVADVEGGAGSSLRAEQKRQLRLRGDCSLLPDGRTRVIQEMFNPRGSKFCLLAAGPAETEREPQAPDAETYVAAGIAFCFMTQLGRYAQIVKRQLDRYWIVQDLQLSAPPTAAAPPRAAVAEPVVTHLFVESPEDADFARQLLDMGEQTCFLHALCRTPLHVETTLDEY